MSLKSDSGDVADTEEQYLCQQIESVSDSRDNSRRAIEAVACTIFVQATIALHSDCASNRGIVDREHNESFLKEEILEALDM